MTKKAFEIFLVFIFLISSIYAEWLSPISATSPSGNWSNLGNAYDGSTSTYASDSFLAVGWAGFIELTLSTNVTCNQVKVMADFGQNGVDTVNIEVYDVASANWVSIRNGSITDGAWSYVTFNSRVISKVRFQYHFFNTGLVFWLYELAVWNVVSPPVTPSVLTKLATSEDDGGGIIHGQITDDGHLPCQYRFEYGLTAAYGQATTWSGELSTGQEFSTQLTGLNTGDYYHYRAEAKNTEGTVYGSDRYFWAKQPNLGWLSPTGTTDTQNIWENPALAHDDDTNTYTRAFTAVNDPSTWSPFLYLAHSAITSNAVRFNARVDGTVDQADVDVLRNGVWTDVYEGTASNSTYNIYTFVTGSVTEARIRFHKGGTYGMYYALYEFDIYKLEQAQNAPVITVNAVMDIVWVNDLILENGESTTKFIIRRNLGELYAAKLKIDGPALMIDYNEDYTGIIVTKNQFGLPMMIVPSTNNSFGAYINNHPTKSVLLEFNLEQPVHPIVMLDAGAGLQVITDYSGKEKNGLPGAYLHHISSYNYTADLKRLTFYTEKFSTFSIGAVSTVNIAPTASYLELSQSITLNIRVLDVLGGGVESAPVTVSLLSGNGTLSSTNLLTDSAGNAAVRYTGPGTPTRAVLQALCDTKTAISTLNVGTFTTLNLTPLKAILLRNTLLTLNISAIASDGSGVPLVPVTLSILSGTGVLSTQNFFTDQNGSANVLFIAPLLVPTQTVLQATAANKSVVSTLSIELVSDLDIQPDGAIVTPSGALRLTINVTANDSSPAAGVPVTVSIISGGGTLSSANLTTNTSGNAFVTFNASAVYGITQITAECFNASRTNTFYVQNGTIRYVPLAWGGVPSYNTIQAALNACNAGDMVLVKNNRYNEQLTWPNVSNILLSGENDSGSLNCIISANNTTQCIYNGNAVNLTVKNMYLTNGNNGGAGNQRWGGGITISDATNVATLNLINVAVSRNQVTLSTAARRLGGGIYFIGRKLNIIDSFIGNNTATGTNGGGGIYVSNGTVSITGSMIKNNAATVGAGGGLYMPNTTSTATLNETIFEANRANTNGGAIYQGNIVADACTFSANTATQNGGVFAQALISLNFCVLSGNSCVTDGGVIYGNALTGTNYIDDSLIVNNKTSLAAGTDGGCFWYSNNTPRIKLSDSIISNNYAANGGFGYQASCTVDRCVFVNNRATNGSGGAFYQTALEVNSSIFVSHNATTSGGVFRSNGVLNIVHCTIASNNAPAAQGQVIFRSGGTPLLRNSIVVSSNSPFNDTTPVITYSLLPAAYTGAGNTTGNPLFRDPAARNFKLKYDSPCINTATQNIPAIPYDLAYVTRQAYEGYDRGAYEYADLFLSNFSPTASSTENITAQISFLVRDFQHASGNIYLSLTVNNVPTTAYAVISNNAVASTNMRVQFSLKYNTNTTYNVTVNAFCLADPEMIQTKYWFTTKRVSPNIVVTGRSMTVSRSAEYTGENLIVPGSVVTYYTFLANQTTGNAFNCVVSDKLPPNTHLYYLENISPSLNGVGLTNVIYQGPTGNIYGPNTQIQYKFDMDGNAVATFNYSVTID